MAALPMTGRGIGHHPRTHLQQPRCGLAAFRGTIAHKKSIYPIIPYVPCVPTRVQGTTGRRTSCPHPAHVLSAPSPRLSPRRHGPCRHHPRHPAWASAHRCNACGQLHLQHYEPYPTSCSLAVQPLPGPPGPWPHSRPQPDAARAGRHRHVEPASCAGVAGPVPPALHGGSERATGRTGAGAGGLGGWLRSYDARASVQYPNHSLAHAEAAASHGTCPHVRQ